MRLRAIGIWMGASACLTLAACSGGSAGGVNSAPPPTGSAPAPTPTPTPTPTNSTITNLQANQGFAVDGASTTTAFDLTTRTVTSASTSPTATQVSYDAATRSYAVTTGARSQTFAPADIQTGSAAGETRYVKSNGTGTDYLTLVTTPYSGTISNRYVGLGYWQRNASTASVQSTSLDSFVYGLETPGAAVPRSGSAGYVTDNFGFVTVPGKAPLAFTGAGTFNIDLALGTFASNAYVTEYELTSERAASGGSIRLTTGGHLGSSNRFTGNMTYSGSYATVSGTVTGRFFGPGAEELGATFSGDNAAGAAVTGSFTGQASPTVLPVNVSITNYVADQLFYTSQGMLSIGAAVNYRAMIGQVTRNRDGSIVFVPGESDFPSATFAASDQIADGPANYVTYRKIVNGAPATLSVFKPGSANTELALSYAGFGSWAGGAAPAYDQFESHVYFAYGITTPLGLLSRRTGTASYIGVAHGVGAATDGTLYDVAGTSRFGVDFSAQSFNGSLQLSATRASGGGARDLGAWTFANHLGSGQMFQTDLTGPAGSVGALGSISPQFYGPDGEEIAATFALQTGPQGLPDTLAVVGATVAKRQ